MVAATLIPVVVCLGHRRHEACLNELGENNVNFRAHKPACHLCSVEKGVEMARDAQARWNRGETVVTPRVIRH
jgi:hypothetical protein